MRQRRLTGATCIAAVIGHPVRHSLSPAIHNAGFAAAGLDWAFAAFEVAPGGVGAALDAMRALGLGGLSVTMPHKDDACRLVDERTATAAVLGAVNCVVPLPDGRLRGDNTDGAGFVAALAEARVDPEGGRAVVIGAGGAARAVVAALAAAGAAEVVVVNRTASRAATAAALAGPVGRVGTPDDVAAADLVVNATSVGMGDDRSLPVDPSLLRAGQVVADVVVHPLDTPLLLAARAARCHTVDGLGMLVHQAAAAFERWTGVAAPVAAMREGALAEVREREKAPLD